MQEAYSSSMYEFFMTSYLGLWSNVDCVIVWERYDVDAIAPLGVHVQYDVKIKMHTMISA